jgi:hypothetical protein
VSNAIDAYRAAGVRFGVLAPGVVTANVGMTLAIAAGYDKPTVAGQVQTAVSAYINRLGLGNSLPYTRLAQVAYDTSPGVVDVTAMTVNGGTSDLAATPAQTVKCGAVTVGYL